MRFRAVWVGFGVIALVALAEPRTSDATDAPATAPATRPAEPHDSIIVTPGPSYSGHLMQFQALQKPAGVAAIRGGYYLVAITDDALPLHMEVSADVEDDVVRVLADQPPGILLDVATEKLPTNPKLPDREIVKGVRIYPADPAEFEPGVFVFQGVGQTYYGKQAYPAVNLRKLGVSGAAAIPTHVVAGASQPDALLMARIGLLKDGQLVEAQVQTPSLSPPMLVGIDPYIRPRVGQILEKTRMISDEFGNETPALRMQWDDETVKMPLAAIDGTGKPIPKSQIALGSQYQPGEILRFSFRRAGAVDQIKSIAFVGQVTRTADDRVHFDIPDVRLVMIESGKLVQGLKLFVWSPPDDSEKFLRGIHQLLSQPQSGRSPLGLAGAQLGLLERIDQAMPPEPCPPDEMESLKGVVREYCQASSGYGRRQASQKIFWALALVVQKRQGRFEQLAQRAKGGISNDQYQSILSMGQGVAPTISDDPDALAPSTQPAITK